MMQKRKSTPRSRCDLPEHLVSSIFEYLPVMSLLKFLTVSKTISSLVHKSYFVAAYVKHSRNNFFDPQKHQNVLFHFVMHSNSTRLRLYNETTESPFAVYDLPGNQEMAPIIIGYCNGIVCLLDSNYGSIYLWNPLINKTLKQEIQHPFQLILFIGFGYDYSNNNCKVVLVFKDEMNQVGAELYAISGIGNTNKWRISSINPPPQEFRAFNKFTSVYASKVLHWLIIDSPSCFLPNSILSFHIEDQVFEKLALPGPLLALALTVGTFSSPILIEFKGMLCVCLSEVHFNEPYFIWMMKDYGKAKSWVPFVNIQLGSFEVLEHKYNFAYLKMVGLKNNGEEFWVQNQKYLYSPPSLFNPKTLKLKDLKNIPKGHYLFSGTYMESLAMMDVEEKDMESLAVMNVEDGEGPAAPPTN